MIAIATGIVVSLAGAVGFLFRAYTQAKSAEVTAKDETIALARTALVDSSLAMREAASAMVRQAEAQSQGAQATSQLVAAMNAGQATSSKEHAAVIAELAAQRRERSAHARPSREKGTL